MNFAKEKVIALVAEELSAANAAHCQFHSLHEGYAVLREEVDECQDEQDEMLLHANGLWQAVKRDRYDLAAAELKAIESTAIRLAAEAIQVAAMARKAMETVPESENK